MFDAMVLSLAFSFEHSAQLPRFKRYLFTQLSLWYLGPLCAKIFGLIACFPSGVFSKK
jgi:hypothetical protein